MAFVEWFEFQVPGRIICSEHCVDSVGLEVNRAGGSRVMIVTDENVQRAGLVGAVVEGMESGSVEVMGIFNQVPRGSELKTVQACYDHARKLNVDCLVSVGGGSVIDTAKATTILMVEGGELLNHHGFVYMPSSPLPPHIAVPTTSGTGAEVTYSAFITDEEQKLKLLFRGPGLAPDIVLLDPVMTKTMPAALTASTGMDALSHCIEALYSKMREPICDGLASHAISLIKRDLPAAFAEGDDLEARTSMAIAANMGGICIANVFFGVVHALSHALGGRFGIPHGELNAVLLPYGMELNLQCVAEDIPARYRLIAEGLGLDVTGKEDMAAAELAVEGVRELRASLGLPARLEELGVPRDGLEAVAADAMREAAMSNNPGECTVEDLLGLLERAY